ncbi:MAG: winged helix-turn-helix domain-containing protein, partial [Actinomycetota bacterium]
MPRLAAESADIELDLGRYEVRRRGRRVKLEKKPMELLILLAARREQLVLRQEIVARLWGSDLFVDTERSINNIVRKIRTALGDHPTRPRFVETVVGKGYRFIGPLRIIHGGYPTAESAAQNAAAPQAHAVSDLERCSLAVLPFSVLGSGADDSGLSLGFADALIARLGNLRGVDVLSTSSVMALSADATPSEIAVQLGVRFVVRGAIRLGESQSRLSAEVFDVHSQSACFSKKHDLQLDRLFDFKDDLAMQIAAALKRPLRQPGAHTRPRYSRDPLAYAEFMRG